MFIPKKLKIGGHIYDVIYPYHYTERGDQFGDHDPTQKWIRIDDRDSYSHEIRTESSVAVTFLHEILHACDSITGNKVFTDEKVCEGISEALFQILRDNKLVFTKED